MCIELVNDDDDDDDDDDVGQDSLTVLNVSGNGLTSLSALGRLHQLRQLSATDNCLSDVGELSQLLATSWRRLERLDVADNSRLCRPRSKYRDLIILAAPALGPFIFIFTFTSNTTVYYGIHERSERIPVDSGVTNLIHDHRK